MVDSTYVLKAMPSAPLGQLALAWTLKGVLGHHMLKAKALGHSLVLNCRHSLPLLVISASGATHWSHRRPVIPAPFRHGHWPVSGSHCKLVEPSK